jgi:protein TonB
MEKEFVGSALIHGGLVIGALLFMGLPQEDDAPAMGAVTVDIISSSLVTTNLTEVIESDATETLVLSGAQATISDVGDAPVVEPLVPQTPTEQTESIDALPSPAVSPTTAEVIEPSEASPSLAEPANAPVLAALNAETADIAPAPPALEPVEVSDEPRRIEPVMPVPRPPDLKLPRPAAEPPREQPASPPEPRAAPQQAGNGGNSDQDSAASRSTAGQAGQGSGGSADEARYPGQVERKVARALRYPSEARGAQGEAVVTFSVGASGGLLSLGIGRSSGDAILDQAALATVQRAAPFPAFPAGSARTSWDFAIPLVFSRD